MGGTDTDGRSEVENLIVANRLKEARSAVERGSSVRDANLLVRALCNVGDVSGAKSLVLNLRNYGVEPNSRSYEAILSVLAKGKRLDEASTFLADMRRQGDQVSADALHSVIWSCLAEERHSLAKELFFQHLALCGQASDKLVMTMLSGYVANGKPGEARQLLFLMKETFGLMPEEAHLNLAVRASLRMGEAWEALELLQFAHAKLNISATDAVVADTFQLMISQSEFTAVEILCEDLENVVGLKPTWDVCVPLLEGLGKSLFVFELMDFLSRMEMRHALKPSVSWLNDLLDELCQKARLDLAEEVLRNVKAKWDVKSFSGIVREASTMYDIAKVNEYFDLMEHLGIRPDIFAWNCRLRCEYNLHGRAGRDRIRRMIEEQGVKFDSYTTKVLQFPQAKRPTAKLQRRKHAYDQLVCEAIAAGKKEQPEPH